MLGRLAATLGAVAAAGTIAVASSERGDQRAPAMTLKRLSQARAAMGGQELLTIKTLSFKARQRIRNRFFGQAPPSVAAEYAEAMFEARILLPDHFLYERLLRFRLGEGRSRGGFAGNKPLGSADINQERRLFGYNYALPLFLGVDTAFPFSLREVAGDTLSFRDPDNAEVLLDLDPDTQLPSRVRYKMGMQGEQRDIVTQIGDYRHIPGFRSLVLPYKLVQYAKSPSKPEGGLVMVQETIFETIEVNVPLTPKDFAVVAVKGPSARLGQPRARS